MAHYHNDGGGKILKIILPIAAAVGVAMLVKSKLSPRHKRKLKGWMLKMKGEVMENVENLKNVTAEVYENVVDRVAEKYADFKEVDSDDLERWAKVLKYKWRMKQRKEEKDNLLEE